MPGILLSIAEIDDGIAAVRENLRDSMEQDAVYSGTAGEELALQRIAEQKAQLERLMKQRDELSRSKS